MTHDATTTTPEDLSIRRPIAAQRAAQPVTNEREGHVVNRRYRAAIGFAMGRGLSLNDVARAAGISATTLRKYYTSGMLGDARFQRLAEMMDDAERFSG